MPTDCRVVLQLQAECFRRQDDATMKVASTHATPSTHSPIDGRNIAPPVSVPDRGGRSLQTPAWMSVFTVFMYRSGGELKSLKRQNRY